MKFRLRLHPPTTSKFVTALVLMALAMIGQFSPDTKFVGQYQFWLAVAAFVVITLDCVVTDGRSSARR